MLTANKQHFSPKKFCSNGTVQREMSYTDTKIFIQDVFLHWSEVKLKKPLIGLEIQNYLKIK